MRTVRSIERPRLILSFEGEIVPGFKNVREKGLNLIDASELHHLQPALGAAEVASVESDRGDSCMTPFRLCRQLRRLLAV